MAPFVWIAHAWVPKKQKRKRGRREIEVRAFIDENLKFKLPEYIIQEIFAPIRCAKSIIIQR
jgi:hypothetical protein